eukprot:138863_1
MMIFIILATISFILIGAKAETNILDIDYLPSTNVSLLHFDCDLSVDLSLEGVAELYPILSSNNENILELLLYWIHSHLFTLIDSSFLYDVDEYTDDFWSEYYLHLTTISNTDDNTIHLFLDMCVTQPPAHDTLQSELTNDDDEIAAFIRYKLTEYIQTNHQEMPIDNIDVSMVIVNAISTTQPPLFVADATSPDTQMRTLPHIITSIHVNDSVSNPSFIFTENMFYVAIIGFVMIISTMVVTVFCVLCIKQATDKRLQTALQEIESNRNGSDRKGKPLGTNDMTSIEPFPIPSHLASIDTGLNVENILDEIDDNSSDSSINIQRNKLGLKTDTYSRSKKHLLSETESHLSEMEQLNGSPIIIDDILSSSPSSLPNRLFIDDTGRPLHSMSARLSHHLNRKKDDTSAIYNPLPQPRSLNIHEADSLALRDTQIRRYNAKDSKYEHAKRHSSQHNIARKPYAKRNESNKRSARSHSKPNLRLKHSKNSKRHKPHLHSSYSQKEVFARKQRRRKRNKHNARYSLQIEPMSYSNKPRAVFPIREHGLSPNSMDSGLSLASVHSNPSHMMLYEHKESVDVDAIDFDRNGHLKIDMNKHPPIPNPPQLDTDMVKHWESDSDSSIVCKTPTTKGTPSGALPNSTSDAHSQTRISNHSVSSSCNKATPIEDPTTPPPPPPPIERDGVYYHPPPPPPIEPSIRNQSSIQSNYSQTVIIRVAPHLDDEEDEKETEEEGEHQEEEEENEESNQDDDNVDDPDAKYDTLSTIAVQSSTVLPFYAPNL